MIWCGVSSRHHTSIPAVREWVMVGLGGALGALGRYGVSEWTKARWGTAFPWGTLIVNVSGAFLLGLIAGSIVSGRLPRWTHHALGAGFMGAFTTFSAFSLETLALLEDGKVGLALGNTGANLIAGVAGAAAGCWIAGAAPATAP